MAWEDAIENPIFFNCLQIMSMCKVGTIFLSYRITQSQSGSGSGFGSARNSRSGNHKWFGHLGGMTRMWQLNSWNRCSTLGLLCKADGRRHPIFSS